MEKIEKETIEIINRENEKENGRSKIKKGKRKRKGTIKDTN
jgi:hypothetical protein